MDGVTILYTYQTYSFWEAVLLATLAVTAALLTAMFFAMLDENTLVSVICAALVIVVAVGCRYVPRSETIHEVLIEDKSEEQVSWKEFNEHYEVLQARGMILRVKEKVRNDGQSIHAE